MLSFVPAFELGLWNAWVLVVPMLILFFFDVRVTAARESGQSGDFQLTRKERLVMNAVFLPLFSSFVYAVFLPLQLGATWLFGGLFVFAFGVVFAVVAVVNFAAAPKDKLVTEGLYRFSRNPMYVGLLLMQIGLGIACASWLYLLLTAVLFIVLNANLSAEERYCLYMYGDDYRKYVNRTPRWLGIPKSNGK